MNGGQDLGGMMGFGPVMPETDEPIFHAEWERRALGLTLAMGATGAWTGDASRHARETLPPQEYLTSSYYEIWIKGLTKLLLAKGLVSIHELYGDQPIAAGQPVERVLAAADVPAVLAAGTVYARSLDRPARFSAGDRVVARNDHPVGHTRLPRYARGRPGTIVSVNGGFVFPDANAHGKGEDPQWCYTVRFAAADLWGSGADPSVTVMADLWEPHLDAA
jgi:nitrile hydratase